MCVCVCVFVHVQCGCLSVWDVAMHEFTSDLACVVHDAAFKMQDLAFLNV